MLNSIYKLVAKYIWPISFTMLAIVTIASLLPLPVLPEVPGGDKTHHLVSYALIILPISVVKPKHWLFFMLAVIVLSGVIELIQPFFNRYGEWLDLIANVCGLFVGYMLACAVKHCLRNCFFG